MDIFFFPRYGDAIDVDVNSVLRYHFDGSVGRFEKKSAFGGDENFLAVNGSSFSSTHKNVLRLQLQFFIDGTDNFRCVHHPCFEVSCLLIEVVLELCRGKYWKICVWIFNVDLICLELGSVESHHETINWV